MYAFRNDILQTENSLHIADDLLQSVVEQLDGNDQKVQFPLPFSKEEMENKELASKKAIEAFEAKVALQKEQIKRYRPDLAQGEKIENILREVIRSMMIRKVDHLWQGHLLSIDHLRSDIQMRTVGQKDPLLEFKHESFKLFEQFFNQLREEISQDLFRFEMVPKQGEGSIDPKTLPFGKKSKKALT